MRGILLSATMIFGFASFASAATYDWKLTGADTGSGQLTVSGPMTVSYTVTGGTDPGSVSTTGYDILSFTGSIDGHSVSLTGGLLGDQPGFLPNPPDPGTPPGVSGSPAFSPFGLSYDNILYVHGTSVLIPCELTPALTNQYLDAYGVVLSYNGIEAEIWGNGPFGPPSTYTFATQNSSGFPNGPYLSSNNMESFAISTPEPSTWAMMLIAFAGLASSGYLSSRKRVRVAA